MTRYFLVVIYDNQLAGRPLPEGDSMSNKVDRTRPVVLTAVNRTYDIMVAQFGNAWRMPKSVRDNYRGMIAVDSPTESSYTPDNDSDNWRNGDSSNG